MIQRARVAEAMLLLLAARLLIAYVPMRWWRGSLGRVAAGQKLATDAGNKPPRIAALVVAAVQRAAQRLPLEMLCLPRAMAVQWMLRRRRCPSILVFGIGGEAPQRKRYDLHAWVETHGMTVIGADLERTYHRGLCIEQP